MERIMDRVFRLLGFTGAALLMIITSVALSHRERVMQLTRAWQERSDGSEIANKLQTPHDVLEYAATHPEQVALCAWTLGAEQDGIFVNADVRRPVTGLSRLLLLAEYARRVQSGSFRADEPVSLAEWERYWLDGLDGGAHVAALHQARAEDRVRGAALPMRDVVRAMIRGDDDAASDWLLGRIGRESALTLAQRLGHDLDPPLPASGTTLVWRSAPVPELLARYRVLGAREYAADAYRFAEELAAPSPSVRAPVEGAGAARPGGARDLEAERESAGTSAAAVSGQGPRSARAPFGGEPPSMREQAQLSAALGPFGTARSYAALMARVAGNELPESGVMREQLEWATASARQGGELDVLAHEGGSSPGTIASASYARAKGDATSRVLVVLWRNLPPAVWLHLTRSFLEQRFERELLTDDAFFHELRERLDGAAALTRVAQEESRRASSL